MGGELSSLSGDRSGSDKFSQIWRGPAQVRPGPVSNLLVSMGFVGVDIYPVRVLLAATWVFSGHLKAFIVFISLLDRILTFTELI